ncbi:MAG TPA: sigma factor [Tepidisphaeraceae bacterium]|nr:sigma factor [Tepidisphaeraceae bacterium]
MAQAIDPWRDLLARHGPALLLFARQGSECASDAQDAVQEGFVRYWRARARARDDVSYLYSCVRTAALDLARASRRMRARKHKSRRRKAGHPRSRPASIGNLPRRLSFR